LIFDCEEDEREEQREEREREREENDLSPLSISAIVPAQSSDIDGYTSNVAHTLNQN
jgi:hypothetical protein